MGDIGDQVRLQAFALNLLLQRGFQTGADIVEALRQGLLLGIQVGDVDLIAGLPGGETADGVHEAVHLHRVAEEEIEDPEIEEHQGKEDGAGQQIDDQLIQIDPLSDKPDEQDQCRIDRRIEDRGQDKPSLEALFMGKIGHLSDKTAGQTLAPQNARLVPAQHTEEGHQDTQVNDGVIYGPLAGLPGFHGQGDMGQPDDDKAADKQHDSRENGKKQESHLRGILVLPVQGDLFASVHMAGHPDQVEQGEEGHETSDDQQHEADDVEVLHGPVFIVGPGVGIRFGEIGVYGQQQVEVAAVVGVVGRQRRNGIQRDGLQIRVIKHGIARQVGVLPVGVDIVRGQVRIIGKYVRIPVFRVTVGDLEVEIGLLYDELILHRVVIVEGIHDLQCRGLQTASGHVGDKVLIDHVRVGYAPHHVAFAVLQDFLRETAVDVAEILADLIASAFQIADEVLQGVVGHLCGTVHHPQSPAVHSRGPVPGEGVAVLDIAENIVEVRIDLLIELGCVLIADVFHPGDSDPQVVIQVQSSHAEKSDHQKEQMEHGGYLLPGPQGQYGYVLFHYCFSTL